MNFLGINAGHGASCALMVNGKIKLVYQEERFTKIKNFGGYPRKSIENCLKYIRQEKININIAAFVNTNPNLNFYKYPISNYFNVKDYKDFYGDKYYSKLIANKSVKKYLDNLNKDKRNKSSISLEKKN